MEKEQQPDTDFGNGGVGGQKQPFVGNDQGLVSDEQRLPDEGALDVGGPSGGNLPTQGATGEQDRGGAGAPDSRLLDDSRHSGLSGGEASS